MKSMDGILRRRQHDYFPRNLGDEKGSESRSVNVMTANMEGSGEVYGDVILGRRQHDPMQCHCPLWNRDSGALADARGSSDGVLDSLP